MFCNLEKCLRAWSGSFSKKFGRWCYTTCVHFQGRSTLSIWQKNNQQELTGLSKLPWSLSCVSDVFVHPLKFWYHLIGVKKWIVLKIFCLGKRLVVVFWFLVIYLFMLGETTSQNAADSLFDYTISILLNFLTYDYVKHQIANSIHLYLLEGSNFRS